jgi:hypothetical protein
MCSGERSSSANGAIAARDGRERQITAVPLGIIDRTVHVADIESDKDQRIRLDKIQWVRVLTEAEEEQFL